MVVRAALVTAMLSALGATAQGQTPRSGRRYTLLPLCDGSLELGRLGLATRTELSSKGWRSSDGSSLRPHVLRRCPAVSPQTIREALRNAENSFYAVEFEAATQALEGIVETLETAGDQGGYIDILVRAYVLLGWLAMEQNRDVRARRYFTEAVILTPTKMLSAMDLPPQPRRSYEEVRRRILAGVAGQLEVSTDLPKTKVTLDGQHSCLSPCTFPGLVSGRHFLVAESLGHAPLVSRVDVHDTAPTRVALRRETDVREGLDLQVSEEACARMVRTADSLDSDALLVFAPSMMPGGKPDVVVALAGGGCQKVSLADGSSGDDAVRVVEALTVLAEQPAFARSAIEPEGSPTSLWVGVHDKWWFWTGVAALSAALVAGTVYALAPGDRQLNVRVVPESY